MQYGRAMNYIRTNHADGRWSDQHGDYGPERAMTDVLGPSESFNRAVVSTSTVPYAR